MTNTPSDIPDRKLNEALLNSLPYATMLIRKDRTVVAVNKIATIFGVEVGGFCWDGFGKLDSLPPSDRDHFRKHCAPPAGGTKCTFCRADRALAAGEPARAEVNKGNIVWDTHWVPITDELFLHYAVDVTHIVNKEVEKHSAEWFIRAQEIAKLGNWDQDPRGGTLHWSDEVYRIFGIAPQSVALTFDQFLEMVHPNYRQRVVDETQRALQSYDHPYQIDYQIIRPDKSMAYVHEEAKIQRDADGEPTRIVGIIQDITESKKAAEEREKLILQLEQALAEIKTLRGIIPICSSCKKVRDDEGFWNEIEAYIDEHTEAEFSHSFCPECVRKLYPDLVDEEAD